MRNESRRLVLIVDTDQRFIDDTRPLLAAHRVVTARDLDEAHEIVLGGRVDLVLLGPAFSSDVALSQARTLLAAEPSIQIALAADVVTNRLLKAALKGGFTDVLDTPLAASDLADLIGQLPPEPQVPAEIEFVVEPAVNAESPDVDQPQQTMPSVLDLAVARASDLAPPPASTPPLEPPMSVATPAEITFIGEPVAPGHPVADEPTPPEAPPDWPAEDGARTAPQPAPVEVLAPIPTGDVLDQVLPPPPMPPPISAPDSEPVDSNGGAADKGRVIAVMAGKGGSGKTITATNLALAIGARNDLERVAIVDADLQFGDVALMFQIDPVRTLNDLVGQLDQMSDERVDAVLLRHESGIRILPAPPLPVRAEEIDAKSVVEVVERLRSMFDTVIVDTGPVFDDGLVTILEHADQIITVVEMDLPSVKNAKVALDGLRQIGFDMGRIRLVVNRDNSKARLDLGEIERSLGLRVGGSIPSDRLIPQSVNLGVPALALSPRSKVARAFHALAESLDQEGAVQGPVA